MSNEFTKSSKLNFENINDYCKENGKVMNFTESNILDEIKSKLIKICKKILDIEEVDINDTFFDLGGHSLKVIELECAIEEEFSVNLSISEIFNKPTIKEIADYINKSDKKEILSIFPVAEREYYPVSWAQKGIFLLGQHKLSGSIFNMNCIKKIEGKLDVQRFNQIFKRLISRHEAFRTSFEMIDGKLMQKVHKSIDFQMSYIETEEGLEGDIIKELMKPFDFQSVPLFRAALIKVGEEKHILVLVAHHIIFDGISLNIMLKEIFQLYNGEILNNLKIQYKDFSVWQNQLLNSEIMKSRQEYWINRLSGDIPVLNVPSDFSKKSNQDFMYSSKKFFVLDKITKGLEKLAREQNTTLYTVVLAIYTILLSKYSGQDDIIIGTLTSGRNRAGLEKIIGMFVNTLPIRNSISMNDTFLEFLQKTKENILKDFENQDYPFDMIVDNISKNLSTERKYSVNPLFDTMLVFHNEIESFGEKMDEKLKIQNYYQKSNPSERSKGMDIYLDIFLSENSQLFCILGYNASLFKESTIDRFVSHFNNIASEVIKNTSVKLSDIDILSEQERNQILFEFNNTKAQYKFDITMHELFEQQVDKNPNNIAIICENKEVTYRELNEKSNQLARLLRNAGIKPNNIVGIVVERSVEMIIGLIGILKAGGAYLPIEPSYPEERIQYLLENSKANFVITQEKYKKNINSGAQVILVDNPEVYRGGTENLCKINISVDLAYTVYTSGSTGNPKGVMITHQAAINTILDINNKFAVNEDDRIIGLSSVSFDLSVYDIFGALSAGATLVQIKDQLDVVAIAEVINQERITIWNSVPAIMDMFIENIDNKFINTSLRLVMLSGDWIPLKLPEKIIKTFPNAVMISLGGATEASIWSIYFPIKEVKQEWSSIPYGVPLSNQTFYVLDKGMQLCPYCVPGELYIGGIGVAIGYMYDTQKTIDSFIIHPQFGRLYKTGDWGRFNQGGYIEFLGRKDHQVKIRGFRIELEEIEAQLLNTKLIKEALVIPKQDFEGNQYLCSYIVCENDFDLLILKEYLSDKLPKYMIPSYFIKLKNFPLTQNGKVDRRALPEPDISSILKENKYSQPTNEIEIKIAQLWSEALGIEKIGIDDDFFQLGGHSLKAITTVLKMKKELNVDISVSQLFNTPTIRQITEFILNADNYEYHPIELLDEKEYYPTSFSQKRLYVANQMDIQVTSYNIPVAIKVEGIFDKEKVNIVFNQLLERHEALRTSFKLIDDKLVQQVHDQVDFNLFYIDNSSNEVEDTINDLIVPFDLSTAPLIRAGIIRIAELEHILFIDIHHIVSDGISFDTILNEFFRLYEGYELPALKVQYKEFAVWQNKLFETGIFRKQEQYWLDILSGEIPLLNMPLDYSRPQIKSFEGDKIEFFVDQELLEDLRILASETDTTLYMVLIAAYNVLLAHYANQDDIIVGTPISGRAHADFENVVGMFVNTLIIRSFPNGDKYFIEFLDEVKQNVLKAYDNQDYPIDMLMDRLKLTNKEQRNYLYDVVFSFQGSKNNRNFEQKLRVSNYHSSTKVSKFDINLTGMEFKKKIVFELEYCTRLFKEETMTKFAEHYIKVLRTIAGNKNIMIKEIELESMDFDNVELDDIEFNF